jgi:hypothetical protein
MALVAAKRPGVLPESGPGHSLVSRWTCRWALVLSVLPGVALDRLERRCEAILLEMAAGGRRARIVCTLP